MCMMPISLAIINYDVSWPEPLLDPPLHYSLTFVSYCTPDHSFHFRSYAVEFSVASAISIREALERKPGQKV